MIGNSRILWTVKCVAVIFFFLGLSGRANSETSSDVPDLQDIGQQLKDNLPDGLPPLPEGLNVTVPTEEEARQLLKEKCEKIGGPGAYEKVSEAKEQVQSCIMSLVNMTELQEEMEKAKPTGDLDIVFRKYCRKTPIFSECVRNFTTTLEGCMEEKEKESKEMIQNITQSLLNFLCFKEGDRIALFIAEGGPECFEEKKEEIQTCANKTMSQYVPQDNSSPLTQLPSFILDKKECRSFLDFQSCVVKSLEGCKEPTPANIIESLFIFVTKLTPCEEERLARLGIPSSVTAISASIGLLMLSLTPFLV